MAWGFSILLVLIARDYPNWEGITICFVGATLRFWASGYLMKDNEMTIGGPYSYTRNPLYLGTYLMAIGVTIAIEAWVLAALLSVLFWAIYHYIILDEEIKLKRLFGKPYENYLNEVSRFFPTLKPMTRNRLDNIDPNVKVHNFEWSVAVKNKAYEAYAAFLGLIGFVTLVAFLWERFGN